MPNVQWRRHDFSLVVPFTESATLTPAGKPAVDVYPFWPAAVRVNATPADGVTGTLVYCGDADLKRVTPATVNGQIAVVETTAGPNWPTLVNLGARAILVLGSAETNNVDLRAHDLPVPVNFPRFFVPPGPLADDLRHGRVAGPATVRARVTWRAMPAYNYYALVRGSTPAGGPPSSAVAVTVPYDSSSLVYDVGPGASQALQAAEGLAVLRDLTRRPPARPVLVCFTGGDGVAFQASRRMHMALSEVPATWRPEAAEAGRQFEAATRAADRARQLLADPSSIDPVKDAALVDRLGKVVETESMFVQEKLFAARELTPDKETPADRAVRTRLEARQAMLSRLAFAFKQRRDDLRSPELAAEATATVQRAVDTLGHGGDTPDGLIGDYADRRDELRQRQDLYKWLANAEGAEPRPGRRVDRLAADRADGGAGPDRPRVPVRADHAGAVLPQLDDGRRAALRRVVHGRRDRLREPRPGVRVVPGRRRHGRPVAAGQRPLARQLDAGDPVHPDRDGPGVGRPGAVVRDARRPAALPRHAGRHPRPHPVRRRRRPAVERRRGTAPARLGRPAVRDQRRAPEQPRHARRPDRQPVGRPAGPGPAPGRVPRQLLQRPPRRPPHPGPAARAVRRRQPADRGPAVRRRRQLPVRGHVAAGERPAGGGRQRLPDHARDRGRDGDDRPGHAGRRHPDLRQLPGPRPGPDPVASSSTAPSSASPACTTRGTCRTWATCSCSTPGGTPTRSGTTP